MRKHKKEEHIFLNHIFWPVVTVLSFPSAQSFFLTVLATENSDGVLRAKLACLVLSFNEVKIDLNLFLSPLLFGLAALNVFYMLLMMHTIVNGMIEEAKK